MGYVSFREGKGFGSEMFPGKATETILNLATFN